MSSHRSSLSQLTARPVDLLVIGGGITGAGIARDAAMRGLRTILVEQHDLAWGTSSRSSRLIHGGLRYLEQHHFRLVFEASRERRVLLRIAPHLVRPTPFLVPVRRGDRLSRWRLAAGLWLYDMLALFRNVGRHRMLGKREVLAREPMLRERGLRGGALYYDAVCDDARLVVATARSAIAYGALVANYMRVESLDRAGDRVQGAVVEDRLTGARGVVAAAVVVNATGPWSDHVRRLEDPGAAPLLRATRGSHIMVPRRRLGNTGAVTLTSPIDGRVMFIVPHGDLSLVGTTDADTAESADEVRPTQDDVVYLLRSANALFPSAHLGPEDVVAAWAGLRPLPASPAELPPSARSRDHLIVRGPAGMFTIVGGKLTTYRAMAEAMVDLVVEDLRRLDGRGPLPAPPTDEEPLPGGEAADLEPLRQPGRELGLPDATIEHLLRHFGTETAAVYNLARADRTLLEPLHPKHPAIEAEVVHVTRRELARRVDDVLMRRLHLYHELPDHGLQSARRTAELMGRELGWGPERCEAEAERYEALVRRWDPAGEA
ncbi:MAG TPA: glycerol-3-phosphate dehydrogenase/oxidase [Gemmatimonadales bacterium]|nr:glycerol-3-phosphate dehydrogenase/oxidase [Gemmatimonadales bacterium]